MSEDSIDRERLCKLLGGAELANLRSRLRARYERGASCDQFTLTGLLGHERRALADLLGRRTLSADSMRLRRSELDAALAHSGISTTLREALEFLDGRLSDRRAERVARKLAWSAALSVVADPRLIGLVSDAAGAALAKRLCAGDPSRAESVLAQAARVLARLPGNGISRAQLAAEVLGDSHGLDVGRPVATLVLRACAAERSTYAPETEGLRGEDETVREQWARLGITVNELALPALCINLPGLHSLPGCPPGRGFAPGEPMHLTLRSLLRHPPTWDVARRAVFVCENPNVVAIAADRLGPACAPLVCTDGMPSAAQQTLLSQLAAGGARLRYHGDFDWAGLVIGNFVMREFRAEPWRFGTADYRGATSADQTALRGNKPVAARWDARLADAMSERRVVVHEEGVVETLLPDLAANHPRSHEPVP